MMREMLKSKIHRATVTDADINYPGSMTIDEELMKLADILPWEKVLIADATNGNRLETYAIPGLKGVVCSNGAAAHDINKGDVVIIMTFAITDEPIEPKIILVDDENKFVKYV
jgi:aspartate 1-decarboxylase